MSSRASELRGALRGFSGAIRENVSLAEHTHIRIGGPARFLAEPATEVAVARLVKVTRELDLPLYVVGGGSNLVVADDGVDGVVMSLELLHQLVRDKNHVTASAGVTLPSLIRKTKDPGLKGLEVLIGIPAHVGGAIAMNAGTHDGTTFEHLVALTLVNTDGEIEAWDRDRMRPGYRNGGIGDRIVLNATWELEEDDPKAIHARLEASLKQRNATQPVTGQSVGCVFTNPEGDSAGRLIEAAGCKLLRRGALSVSGKHANYFVNEGGGTCHDFLELMSEVQRRVEAESDVHLVPEVKVWGI